MSSQSSGYQYLVVGAVRYGALQNCNSMASNQVLLFLVVGRNEVLFEAEIFHKRGGAGNSDAVARQNYFVVHSALDLVEKAAWTTQNVRESSRKRDAPRIL